MTLLAGDGGLGTTFGGTGGNAEVQGGTGGGGTSGGSAGYAALKGGNAGSTGGATGGNIYIVPGIGQGAGQSGSVFLGLSPSLTVRGNTVIGSATDDYLNKLQVTGNTKLNSSATTTTGLDVSSSTITSGALATFTNTGTAAASNTKKVLSIVSSGANASASQTVTGQTISVTNTGTSSTNNGLTITTSGASTQNNAINILAGGVRVLGNNGAVDGSANFNSSNNDMSFNAGFYYRMRATGSNKVILGSGYNGSTTYTYSEGDFIAGTTSAATSTLQTAGSFATAYRAITALRTLDATDHTINCTANTFTVTLPTAASITGRQYTIVNSGSGTITIGTTSSQTFANINATPTTLTLAPVGAGAIVSYTVVSNGANWIVTGKVKDE